MRDGGGLRSDHPISGPEGGKCWAFIPGKRTHAIECWVVSPASLAWRDRTGWVLGMRYERKRALGGGCMHEVLLGLPNSEAETQEGEACLKASLSLAWPHSSQSVGGGRPFVALPR